MCTPLTRRRRRETVIIMKRLIATAALVPVALTGLATPGLADYSEASRVDRVPTPVLQWTSCQSGAECATARLPLDYDHPYGPTTDVALLRIKAKDPAHRLGTVFINPGGPGEPARDFVVLVSQALPGTVLDQFDVVGVDPRGVGGSQQIRCFSTTSPAVSTLTAIPFPDTPAEQRSWIGAGQTVGEACSTKPLADAMSTTEDARDMDVLRRAVGDSKLTYVGLSGGSYLGQVYANMFPDRVRAIALDGIVDPQGYVGTPATASVPLFDRIGAPAASYRALHELLVRCQQVGQAKCSFADADTPARYDRLAAQLRAHPLRLDTRTYTYANFVRDTESWLHDADGYVGLFADLTDLVNLTGPDTDHDAVVKRFLARHPAQPPVQGYDNHFEGFSGKACTDSLHAADAESWPAAAAAANSRNKYFGEYYSWLSVQCARNTWTAQDSDVYRGPFNRRTAAPVLVVGGVWDPATSYDNAVKVAQMLPNSRLVTSESWGHESLDTSACVNNAVFDYLRDPRAPAPKNTQCRGDVQPFMP